MDGLPIPPASSAHTPPRALSQIDAILCNAMARIHELEELTKRQQGQINQLLSRLPVTP